MKKTYPTLYSQDKALNIRIWYIEQNNDRYTMVSGVLNGNLVKSDDTVVNGKNIGRRNETTPTDQATAEILARYKSQRKSGYFDDVKDVGTFQFVEPMLAQPLKKVVKKINFVTQKWIIQCKYNGNRCLASVNGLFTRTGEEWLCTPHISLALVAFFKKYPNAVLDGEFYNYDLREQLNELSRLVKTKVNITPDKLKRSEEMVQFYVYDGYGFDNMDESVPYETRKNWIDKNVVNKYKYISEVKSFSVASEADVDKYFNLFVDDGDEGAILRLATAPYEHFRSNNLVKVKSEDDSEGDIVSISEGTGNWAGAAYQVGLKWEGKVFEGVFKGPYALRKEILKNKKDWIGKTVMFTYMKLTGKGIPNSARVNPVNCFRAD